MPEYLPFLFFLFLGVLIAGAAIVTALLVGYRSQDSKHKKMAYECGIESFGNARIQFKVGYYLFALLFMVFDIESLFLFPAVKIFRQVVDQTIPGVSPTLILIDLSVFVLVLVAGLAYAWRKGALEWE